VSEFLSLIRNLIASGKSRTSEHGFRELREDAILLAELVETIGSAEVVEEHPDYHKGPCILLLHSVLDGEPVHALWGTTKDNPAMATLITAYRPDPKKWTKDFLKRIPK
jgi:Domain of unknown function (DUF4258)